MRKRYRVIGVGGTFDHFHDGHGQLLLFAEKLADSVLIGVTDDKMIRSKAHAKHIDSFEQRVRNVSRFCQKHHINHHITKLSDGVGPTLEDSQVQALAVTKETVNGANKINELRRNLGLRELPVYICDFLLAENKEPLHAQAIRQGIINRQGLVYDKIFDNTLTLTPTQRIFFQEPQGEIISSANPDAAAPFIAVVGDRCLRTFISESLPYHLGIFDGLEQRQTADTSLMEKLQPFETVTNPAGQISPELVRALKQHLAATRKHLKVDGEEDLAAVALVLLLPLGSEIYYGQPNLGMVKMIVTENLKETFYQQLSNTT